MAKCNCGNPNCDNDKALGQAIVKALIDHVAGDTAHSQDITLTLAFKTLILAAKKAKISPEIVFEKGYTHYQYQYEGLPQEEAEKRLELLSLPMEQMVSQVKDALIQNGLTPEEVNTILPGIKAEVSSEDKELDNLIKDNVVPLFGKKKTDPTLN